MNNKKTKGTKRNQNETKKAIQLTGQGIDKRTFLWLAGIIILTYIAFFPSLKNGFTNWDDNVYIGENSLITNLSSGNVKKMFNIHNAVSLNYHPITILSLAIDYKLSGYHAKTYHATNLLFHLLNTALVFWFIFLLSDKKVIVATIVAFFFGIHPMHVESVAWISERKDVLYVFFFMSALIAYLQYLQAPQKNKILLYVLVLIFFLLSVLSKAMAVVLPLVLLLLDYYKGRKFDKYSILEKIPFFLISILFGILASHIQSKGAIAKFEVFTWLQRLSFASYGMWNYIYDLFLPVHLSCFYPYPNLINERLPIIFYISPFIVSGILILVFLTIKHTKTGVFGVLFYCITVALVLQFISVGQAIMADRYSYLSYVGLLFPIGMSYDWLHHQTDKKWSIYKKLTMLLIIIGAITSFWFTRERIGVWKNSDILWTDAINKYPNSEAAYRNRGSYLINKVEYDKGEKNVGEREIDRALEDFNISIKLSPNNAKVFTNRANIYGLKNQFDLSLKDYSKAIELDSSDAEVFANRGVTYSVMKQYDKAIADYNKAIAMNPNLTAAIENRAYALVDIGKYETAIASLNDLIKLNATNIDYYIYRGVAYFNLGNFQAALSDNNIGLQIQPNNSRIYFNRSAANKALGKFKEALDDALKAQSLGYAVDINYLNQLKSKAL